MFCVCKQEGGLSPWKECLYCKGSELTVLAVVKSLVSNTAVLQWLFY